MGSSARSKPKSLGLRLEDISENDIEEIAFKVEEAVRKYIEERTGRRGEVEVVVKISRDGESLNILIDVGLRGGLPGRIPDLDSLLGDSIRVGRMEFEKLIIGFSREASQKHEF
jgi:hypothetical protein